MRNAAFALLLCAAAAATWTGCGSNAKGFRPPGGGDDGGSFTGDDAGDFGDAAVRPCNGQRCSDDLHSVVDCDGHVLMTCPAGQGCSGNGCVPACDSARDNKSSIGCDYYSVDPDVSLDGAGACFAAFVANPWDQPVTLKVAYGGLTLDASTFAYVPSGSGQSLSYAPLPGGQLAPGQVAILFLNRHPGLPSPLKLDCPPGITPAITATDAATHGTGVGTAFHITTSAPVVAYDMFPYGGGQSAMTSATLLLPTTAWDTNYVAVTGYGQGPLDQPTVDIVAQQDGTSVTINPSAAIVGGGGVAATAKNSPHTYVLDHGQVLQFTQDAALDGSVIQSTAPVGLWGGKSALGINGCCDDTAHQQIPPVRALGSEYVGVRYRNRYDGMEESPPWRIVGAADGTVLTWDPGPPPGAPSALSLGQLVEFDAAGPFVVRSQDAQHPFYLASYMTGGQNFDEGTGDPEFVNVIPPAQFLSRYTFFTDPTYPETNLVVVRTTDPSTGQMPDVTLDCAGVLGGWTAVDRAGTFEMTRVDLSTGDFAGVGLCNNGVHVITGSSPTSAFGVTVWGWGNDQTWPTDDIGAGDEQNPLFTRWVSYGYPAGANFKPLNTAVLSAK
jgi:hypothetical protein